MGCEMEKTKVTMNKPVYLGQAILDLSKLVMYEFHYDYMIPKYGKNLKLCYMDFDSLVYHVKTEDFYNDIAGDVNPKSTGLLSLGARSEFLGGGKPCPLGVA